MQITGRIEPNNRAIADLRDEVLRALKLSRGEINQGISAAEKLGAEIADEQQYLKSAASEVKADSADGEYVADRRGRVAGLRLRLASEVIEGRRAMAMYADLLSKIEKIAGDDALKEAAKPVSTQRR